MRELSEQDKARLDCLAAAARDYGEGLFVVGIDADTEEYDAAYEALEKRLLHLNKRASTNPY